MVYGFAIKVSNTQDHESLLNEVKNSPECATAYHYGNVIRVDMKSMSQAKSDGFRKKISERLTSHYGGTSTDVSTLIPLQQTKKSKRNRLNSKNKKILLKAFLFFGLIFAVVFFSLLGVVNPVNALPMEKIIEASLGPAIIAFITEIYSSIKLN